MENNCVLEFFMGGIFGPSNYIYVNKSDSEYIFRSGYDKYGKYISNSSKVTDDIIRSEQEYLTMLEEIKKLTKGWNLDYNNNDILDGTQWSLKFEDKYYYGSNDYPNNFNELMLIFNKYFN